MKNEEMEELFKRLDKMLEGKLDGYGSPEWRDKMKKAQANGKDIQEHITKMIDGLPFILIICSPVSDDVGVIGHSKPADFEKDLGNAIKQFRERKT